jgi:hypothetical protein
VIWLAQAAKWLASGVLNPVFEWLGKREDTALGKYKVDGEVSVEAMKTDIEVIKARTALAEALKDDPTMKWGRRLFIYPTGVWYTSIIIYCVFHNRLPDYTWKILALPPSIEYIPAAVVAFLLVTAWRK